MKKIKVLLFLVIFFWFYSALASNVPLGYWGNNFAKNNEINNTKYDIPLGYIGNNFNKKITYTGTLNHTPIGFFTDYKGKKLESPKINKIISKINTSTGNTIINEVSNNTGSLDNTNVLKEKIRQDKINNLEKRIALAKSSGKIYTYRLREYIKNDDGSFTNIDTLNPYGGNIDNLKLKVVKPTEIKKITPVKNVISIKDTNINNKVVSNIKTLTNIDVIRSNEQLVNKINDDIKKKQELQIKKDLEIRQKMQEKQDKVNNLEKRIASAKSSGEIYTYRLREYIKNNDGTFTNIDTLRPYGGNIERLEKKTDKIKRDLEKNNNKNVYTKKKAKKTKISNKTKKSTKTTKTSSKILKKNYKRTTNKDIITKKEEFILDTKNILENISYIYYAKKKLSEIKKNNFEKYLIIKSCIVETNCTNLNYFNNIHKDIKNSINIDYLSSRLEIDITNNKSLDYVNMLKIIFKVFGKDKYSNLDLGKSEYFTKIDKTILTIFKNDKKKYNKVDFLSYKRIYFSLLESNTFETKLNKLLFN